jgi:hypothetical protein
MRTSVLPLRAFALGLLLLSSGCAFVHPPVPLYGDRADLAALAGDWEGTYKSRDTGRTGGVSFHLTADADSAFGEVVMIVEQAGLQVIMGPYGAERAGTRAPGRPRSAEVLTIRFVRVEGGRVAGTLDPYIDPTCDCPIRTTFEGVVSAEVIEGTFVSRRLSGVVVQRGTWAAYRQ